MKKIALLIFFVFIAFITYGADGFSKQDYFKIDDVSKTEKQDDGKKAEEGSGQAAELEKVWKDAKTGDKMLNLKISQLFFQHIMKLLLSGTHVPPDVLKFAIDIYIDSLTEKLQGDYKISDTKPGSQPTRGPNGLVSGGSATVNVRTVLNFRTSPWGKIQGTFSAGTKVKVLGFEGDWVKVDAGGRIGYLHSNYLQPGAGSSGGQQTTSSPTTGSQPSSGSGSTSTSEPTPPPTTGDGSWGGSPITPGSYWVSSRFGMRNGRPHNGIDLAAPRGTPVRSLGPGEVIFVGRRSGYGKTVEIRYKNGYVGRYAHLDSYAGMKKPMQVNRGDVVGKVDNTGNSRGNHLHFELRRNGSPVNPTSVPGVNIG
ncbi:peptidoglycan DD-metalloendopeptidase family protein [Candidatus Riflebacteria bacterium]